MKSRFIAGLLAALAAIAMACGGDDPTSTPNPTPTTPATSTTEPAGTATPDPSETPGTGTPTAQPTEDPTGTPGAGTPTVGPSETPGTGTPTVEPTGTPGVGEDTLVGVLMETGGYDTLVELIQEAGLEDIFGAAGPYTLFAPTDEAFEALPEGKLEELRGDPQALTSLLSYHLVGGEHMAEDIAEMTTVTSFQGTDIAIAAEGGVITLNDAAEVVETDIQAGNGVIHSIDAVLMPSEDGEPPASPTPATASPTTTP